MSNNYASIRFIGYTIPTTPAGMIPIGNPNGPGAVAGTYLGLDDFTSDITARIAVLKNAVDTAKATLPTDTPGSVLNLFVAPEFFFHGTQGPYLFSEGQTDPVTTILDQLVTTFPASDYPDWSFVFGTAITSKVANADRLFSSDSVTVRNSVVEALSKNWLAAFGPLNGVIFDMLVNFIKNCHAYPAVEVRNRALLVSNVPLSPPASSATFNNMTTEKYFDSNEDFILYDVNGKTDVITEQMTAYPVIDLTNGDLKQGQFDKYAIFRQNYGAGNFPDYVDFGVEVCLDHSDTRLRSNIDNEPFPRAGDAVHVQIVPSCGMQIIQTSVAADTNGFVFNCDGQYALDGTTGPQEGNQSGVECLYVNHVDSGNTNYAGHTQLARVATPATGGDPDAPGSTQATFLKLDTSAISVVEVTATADLAKVFAGGPGEVHIYGPFQMYPS